MAERYAAQLQRLCSLIEASLGERLCLDTLSKEAGLSKYHLHRVFRAAAGYPLAEYVRRRRVAESLSSLLGTDRSVLSIALDFGFAHEQSYTRAFKHCYGITPGRCRRRGERLDYLPPLDPARIRAAGDDGAEIASRLTVLPPTLIWGIESPLPPPRSRTGREFAALAESFVRSERRRIPVPFDRTWFAGITLAAPGDPGGASGSYIAGARILAAAGGTTRSFRSGIRRGGDLPERFSSFAVKSALVREYTYFLRVHPAKIGADTLEPIRAAIASRRGTRFLLPDGRAWALELINLESAREDFGEYRLILPA